ncbi:hypothetical protein HanRHA438_Chr05g0234861 [Helianthus annuus]|nr:hypothetical protein HanRHA438_Chr05g0234861 [Helianthus annuus]
MMSKLCIEIKSIMVDPSLIRVEINYADGSTESKQSIANLINCVITKSIHAL